MSRRIPLQTDQWNQEKSLHTSDSCLGVTLDTDSPVRKGLSILEGQPVSAVYGRPGEVEVKALLIMLATFGGFLLAYRFYGRFIAAKIFRLSSSARTPAMEFEDGVDFVPTRKEIIFGHHYASIAGTGPIVGPAIAVIWGWAPALIWVFVGSIVSGAVHDLGALVISMRNKGTSIAEFSAKYINPRIKFAFFLIVFLELWLVIAIFGLVIAVIFKMYPGSVLPVWSGIPIAVALGFFIYKRGRNITAFSATAVALMYGMIIAGVFLPLEIPAIAGIPPTGVWTIILLIYAFIASVLPVTTLLQPRDFINAHQLIIALALLVIGVVVSAFSGDLHVVAPAFDLTPAAAPPLLPFLFITIACGATSGFHSLVSSGTSAKQIRNEEDSLFVGYGSMLMEGVLSTLVILATTAGIGMGSADKAGKILHGVHAWNSHYSSWTAAAGLGSKVGAFVNGAANMIGSIGIPESIALVIMGVFVASFAGTTLDTATRIQRYVVSELFSDLGLSALSKKYPATAIAVISAAWLAFATGASGKGALILWPLFGAINQTLAALALIIITIYLKKRGGWGWLIAGTPCLFMATVTFWALILNQAKFLQQHKMTLVIINAVILLIAFWVVAEGLFAFFRPERSDA